MKKPKTIKSIKAWAVLDEKGRILTDGWGSTQMWVFDAKWKAVEEARREEIEWFHDYKIIKVLITPIK